MASRYSVPSNEDYQPGSNGKVLKNYYDIKRLAEIEALEEKELKRVISELEGLFRIDYQFSSEDLRAIHQEWLGDIYPMAGYYRSVHMTKDDFPFAAPGRIERLIEEFEKKYLVKYTPCNFEDLDKVIEAISVVHVELMLIHPFREGNGRLGRILATVMANQAGLPPLDFDPIDQNTNPEGFKNYVLAIQQGMDRNYGLMKSLFKEIINVSQQKV